MWLDIEEFVMRDKAKGGVKITHEGDVWRILGVGSVRDDGKTYCHLASETRGIQQTNGWVPMQICDWINLADADDDRDPITSYYEDRANNGQSSREAH